MTFKFKTLLLVLVTLLLSPNVYCSAKELAEGTESISAEGVMKALEDVYKNCNSYSDSGLVQTTFFREDDKLVSETPFFTDYIRDESFRFEFTTKHPLPFAHPNKTIIVKNDGIVKEWRNFDLGDVKKGIQQEESLSMAIAGATGVSGGSAYTIPVLLNVKEIGGWKRKLTSFHSARLIEDGEMEGKSYFRIIAEYLGKDENKQPTIRSKTLWVNKETYLIHRIDTQTQFPNFRTETSTTYNPSININIDKSRFLLTNDV